MTFTRRTVLKGAAAAVAMPAVLRAHDALASSGQVNVFAWGDYVQDNMIQKFEAATGIKVNLSTFGSNDEAENKLRAAGGKGFDVIFPSVTNGPSYYPDQLLAPLDESKVNMDNIIPSMVRDSINLGAQYRGKRYLLPFDWGTEAITFDSAKMPMADGDVSFGSMWAPDATGAAAFRQKSVIMGVGLYLDAIGEVPSNRMLDVYKSEDDARRVWGACTKFILERKQNIAAFWNNATEATAAFTDAGATIGQTWDTTGLLLNREDSKWKYRMPKEGGITWMDSMGVTSGAENVDQAYAFINAMLEPRMAGMFAANTGYNSAVKGAADFAGAEYKKQFNEVYNADTLSNLWWWQADTPFFAPVRQEFVEKITNA
ncbi:extracellular solute-binding protein [Aestuariispira insulae]|uniref:Spermidine/putrescine-binding protein n=1 Tax=Aestuariispira insulae TaxID=1461337 RepID=A0A3D9HXF1_9PROT|nr:extracellular solute-binding protein [Aestuariispira insulae]RED54182.1 spermidine/putrescine-binding protein [Aestuariispira insulae]